MKPALADAWTGMRTCPGRAGLAFGSLALGLFAVTILLAVLQALRGQARDLVRDFGAGAFVLVAHESDGAPGWTRAHVEFFRRNLGTAAAVSGSGRLDDARNRWAVIAADGQLAEARGWRFVAGRPLDDLDVRRAARHAMAPAALCAAEGWAVGQTLTLQGEIYRLVGCYEAGAEGVAALPESAVCIPFTAGHAAGWADSRQVAAVLFRARAGTEPERLRRQVGALLGQPGVTRAEVEWITPETLLREIRHWQHLIGWTAGAGGGLALLLGGGMLAGLLLGGVRERTAEIGLRRALGARRREIAGLFLLEGILLTAGAALVGMGAAEVFLRGLGARFPLPVALDGEIRLLPLALALGLAIVCSAGPAVRAARLPPAEALRND